MNTDFNLIFKNIENALNIALQEKPDATWKNDSFGYLSDCVTNEHLKNLITPCKDLVNLGGKRWRPLLLVLCSSLARDAKKNTPLSLEETYSITPLVEFVHTASLIHDDIEDSADTRRGKPAAHLTWGLDTALNAASWLYFLAPSCIEKLSVPFELKNNFFTLYAQELRRLHLGQAMDIYWHRNPSLFPTVEEYTQMVHLKTGTLASLAVQAGFLAGGATKEEALKAGHIAECIGEGFQILDDVQNLTTGNPGKKRGDDIVEGKKSLPVLLYIQNNPKEKETISSLFETAKNEGIDSPAVEKCIFCLSNSSAIKEAKEKGVRLINEKTDELTAFFNAEAKGKDALLIKEFFSDMVLKFQKN